MAFSSAVFFFAMTLKIYVLIYILSLHAKIRVVVETENNGKITNKHSITPLSLYSL